MMYGMEKVDEQSPISLSDSQKKRAEVILQKLGEGKITHPKHLVKKWESFPFPKFRGITQVGKSTQFVPIEKIVGTVDNTDYLRPERLRRIIKKLKKGEFKHVPPYNSVKKIPHFNEINGKFYVSLDGNHRVLAFKALDLEEIWSRVAHYEMVSKYNVVPKD